MIDIDALDKRAAEVIERSFVKPDAGMVLYATEVRELIEEIRGLRERLEIDPRHSVDGIAARDETIRLQDGEIERLREDAARYAFLKRQARSDPKMDGQHVWYSIPMRNPNGGALRGNTLDEAIDQARAIPLRDCPKCGDTGIPSGVYCKGIDCPLNPARGAK